MSAAVRSVVLDAEAAGVLLQPRHHKHRAVLIRIDAYRRRQVRDGGPRLVVPTTVRVEAGWDRRDRQASLANRLRVHDAVLGTAEADVAVEVRAALGVSVADAHLGAVLASTPGPSLVLTSDGPDVRRVVDHIGVTARVIVM